MSARPGRPEPVSGTSSAGRTILHVDMDAFYAAIEVRERPELAGRPVVVGADPRGGRGRGVVATASYEARRYGIRSAMPISEAYRRCPGATYLRPRMALYEEVSRRIFEILGACTDLVEPLSLDEAFLDVTASRALFGSGPEIARRIRHELRVREGLTASVGVAASKYVAKVASDLEKPDGLVVVPPGTERSFLAPLELSRLWGAGPRTRERLRRLGARTIGDVASLDRRTLEAAFGAKRGRRFQQLARGIDPRPVGRSPRKSLGHETTFERDVEDRERVERTLLRLCEATGRGLRRRGLAGRTVQLKLRWDGFETVTRQRTLARPASTTEEIWPVARALFRAADRPERLVRLVGVAVSTLVPARARQLSLFEASPGPSDDPLRGSAIGRAPVSSGTRTSATFGPDPRHDRVASAMDALNERFGPGSVTRAALLGSEREAGREAREGRENADGRRERR